MQKLSPQKLTGYLERIGYTGSTEPSKQVLDDLIYCHQCAVPFETLDCHDFHKAVDLTPDTLYHKIVEQQRGGYCLELNGLFYLLLTSLGFDARPCMCRVLLGTDEFTHPVDHRTNLVNLDGKTYFCDVGLGGPMPPAGLDISATNWQEMRGEYFCVKPDVPGWYAVVRKTGNDIYNEQEDVGHRTEILFTTITCYETDFIFLNHYMSTHPEALHVAHRILNRRTPDGYRAIWDDVYKESADGTITTCSVTGQLTGILSEKFGIVLPDENRLFWKK